jgi:hypothetical protein
MELDHVVYDLDMGEYHSAAAITGDAKVVKNLTRFLTCLNAFFEWFPLVAYYFPA